MENKLSISNHFSYVCPECGLMINTAEKFWQHLNIKHNYAKKKAGELNFKNISKELHECQVCWKRFIIVHNNIKVLQFHYFSHLPQRIYNCVHCNYAVSRQSEMYQHLKAQHSVVMDNLNAAKTKKTENYQRFMDEHPTKSTKTLAKHNKKPNLQNEKLKGHKAISSMEIDTKDSKSSDFSFLSDCTNEKVFSLEEHVHYRCPECGVEFEEQFNWRLHINTVHKFNILAHFKREKNAYMCIQCLQLLTTTKEEDLQRHRCLHLPYRAYIKCVYCYSYKSSKNIMLQHIKEYHNVQYKTMLKVVNKFPDKITIFKEPLDLLKINEHLKQARRRIDSLPFDF